MGPVYRRSGSSVIDIGSQPLYYLSGHKRTHFVGEKPHWAQKAVDMLLQNEKWCAAIILATAALASISRLRGTLG